MMLTAGWITKAGPFTVEKVAVEDAGEVDLSRPPVGVGHTTEGSFESALSKFRSQDAPNFLVGKDGNRVRIIQLIALGRCAKALENPAGGVETNHWARAQIELAGNSKLSPWLPDTDVLDAFAALVGTLRDRAGIPLFRPFPDRLQSGVVWAVPNNPRRRTGKWGRVGGWFTHLEVPENHHWDMGSFRWTEVFRRATVHVTSVHPNGSPRRPPEWFGTWAQWRLGKGPFKTFGPADKKHRPPEAPTPIPDWAWRRLERLVREGHPVHS